MENLKKEYGEIKSTFYERGLISGRMLSSSKSAYREKYPENEVYFNANIFVLGEGKIWFGDIDITRDRQILEEISVSIGKRLFILKELDGRFENDTLSDSDIISKAIVKIE